MTTKKTIKKKPLETIRRGSVAAEIYCTQSPDGFEYHTFKLARVYKSQSGKELSSGSFFGASATDVLEAATAAKAYIDDRYTASVEP